MGVLERVELGSSIVTLFRSSCQVSILAECELDGVVHKVIRVRGSREIAHDLNGMARKLAKLQCEVAS